MRSTMTRSRILEKTDVSAIGRKSLNKILPVFLGTGTYFVNFKISGNLLVSKLMISLSGSLMTSEISWIIL